MEYAIKCSQIVTKVSIRVRVLAGRLPFSVSFQPSQKQGNRHLGSHDTDVTLKVVIFNTFTLSAMQVDLK